MKREELFLNYVSKLRTPDNTELLECIVKGFGELLEYGYGASADTGMSQGPAYMDNKLSINPNATDFQDNIMEDVQGDDVDEEESMAQADNNPEENVTDAMLGEGLAGAAIQGVKALATNPAVRQGIAKGAKAIYNNPMVRGAAKEAAVGATTAGINRAGQAVQNRLQPNQQPQQQVQQPQQGLTNVQLNANEMALIKQYRQRQGQAQTEAILQEFSPPAAIIPGSGAMPSANPDEDMTSPMISDIAPSSASRKLTKPMQSDMTPGASNQNQTVSAPMMENDAEVSLEELEILKKLLSDGLEKLKNIIAHHDKGREVIMETKKPKN